MQVIDHGRLRYIDAESDARFRKVLLDGVPPSLRLKMWEALSETPNDGDFSRSQRYFGDELMTIGRRIRPLSEALDRTFPGFNEWLFVTGYTNNYKMIKVFNAWAEMKVF